jgi:hypothetical protein
MTEDDGDDEEEGREDKDKEKESWPGPFSTANDMLKKREAVKLARETAIADKDNKRKGCSSPHTATGDAYDLLLNRIASDSSTTCITLPLSLFTPKRSIPRLSSLAVSTVATWWEHVEDLGNLPTTSLAELGSELSKQRKLTPQAVRLMFPVRPSSSSSSSSSSAAVSLLAEEMSELPVHRMLLLSDCSTLDEECIFDLLVASSNHLESLDLKNCGHVFTSHLVDRLVSAHSSDPQTCSKLSLHTLSLTGMYRLQDMYLSKFLTHLIAPNHLHTLNLGKNSCLAHDGVMTLLHCGLFSQLTTLILDSTLLHGAAMAVDRSDGCEEVEGESGGVGVQNRHGHKLYEENAITVLCR